jgi:hypothetical protein
VITTTSLTPRYLDTLSYKVLDQKGNQLTDMVIQTLWESGKNGSSLRNYISSEEKIIVGQYPTTYRLTVGYRGGCFGKAALTVAVP